MTIQEAVQQRHSVRQYSDTPLSDEHISVLQERIGEYNAESGLHIQLVIGEERAFSGLMARYGKFAGVRNYFALIGPKSAGFREKMGYYGEKLVLDAQMMGLNTCWVGVSFSKIGPAVQIAEGEEFVAVITVGYGVSQGVPHRSRTVEELSEGAGVAPSWFRRGVECAMFAPSAMNHQNFHFIYDNSGIRIVNKSGICSELDLGIARLHFEIGAGKENVHWAVDDNSF